MSKPLVTVVAIPSDPSHLIVVVVIAGSFAHRLTGNFEGQIKSFDQRTHQLREPEICFLNQLLEMAGASTVQITSNSVAVRVKSQSGGDEVTRMLAGVSRHLECIVSVR